MTVVVNGERTELGDGATIADLVARRVDSPAGVAVSVDLEVVPRSEWATTRLHDGARVEVLVAAAGG